MAEERRSFKSLMCMFENMAETSQNTDHPKQLSLSSPGSSNPNQESVEPEQLPEFQDDTLEETEIDQSDDDADITKGEAEWDATEPDFHTTQDNSTVVGECVMLFGDVNVSVVDTDAPDEANVDLQCTTNRENTEDTSSHLGENYSINLSTDALTKSRWSAFSAVSSHSDGSSSLSEMSLGSRLSDMSFSSTGSRLSNVSSRSNMSFASTRSKLSNISEATSSENSGDDSTWESSGTLNRLFHRKFRNYAHLAHTPEMLEIGNPETTESLTETPTNYQESLQAIITSEESYLEKLSFFMKSFVNHPGIKGSYSVITETHHKELFSNIAAIEDVSKRFLHDLEKQWDQDPEALIDFCNIISDYATGDFNAYIKYCSNLYFHDRNMRKLKESNERFLQIVEAFEAKPECNNLRIGTFLTLPMQRLTQLPLLVKTVHQQTEPNSPDYNVAHKALKQLQELVDTCIEKGTQNANVERNTELDRQLDFKNIKKIAIVSQCRHLVKKKRLTRIFKDKGFLGKKKKEFLDLFVFNDLLIITKPKDHSTKSYQVVDYAYRYAVGTAIINESNISKYLPNGAPSDCDNIFALTITNNYKHEYAEFYFACSSPNERMKWIKEFEGEQIYEDLGESMGENLDTLDSRSMTSTPIKVNLPESEDEVQLPKSDISETEMETEDPMAESDGDYFDEEEFDSPDEEHMHDMSSSVQEESNAQTGTLKRIQSGNNLRSLWCEMPEVQELGVLDSMSEKEKKFQECLFEIITSEESYVRSLCVFMEHFFNHPGLKAAYGIITEKERKDLFSNIDKVVDVAMRIMQDMKTFWNQHPVLTTELCNIISEYAKGDFKAYITYLANLDFQKKKLLELIKSNQKFKDIVDVFKENPECKGQSVDSCLTLPMQRITRMPLLLDAVSRTTHPDSEERAVTQKTLLDLQKLARTCNERARQIADIEQITEIDRTLNFKNIKKIPIVSQSRSLVKKGKLRRIYKENKGFLGNKKKESLQLFLFNDLLIIAKKKDSRTQSETAMYQVIDYTGRNSVESQAIEKINLTKWLPNGVPTGCENLFMLALVDNHKQSHAEFFFSCESESDRVRWIDAVTPVSEDDDGKIYEAWDCPQVKVIHTYTALQPDELTLVESDVINVFKKFSDGWCEGERIRDGERGWFPANHTEEIQNAHVRARNMKQRYRLLNLTEDDIQDSSTSNA